MVDEADHKKAGELRITTGQRLTVVLPSAITIMLFTALFGTSNSFFMVRTHVMYWVSLLSGPLAIWIEFSFQTTREDKVYALLAALALLLGILSHPVRPHIATAIVTILCLLVWCLLGQCVTYAGV